MTDLPCIPLKLEGLSFTEVRMNWSTNSSLLRRGKKSSSSNTSTTTFTVPCGNTTHHDISLVGGSRATVDSLREESSTYIPPSWYVEGDGVG